MKAAGLKAGSCELDWGWGWERRGGIAHRFRLAGSWDKTCLDCKDCTRTLPGVSMNVDARAWRRMRWSPRRILAGLGKVCKQVHVHGSFNLGGHAGDTMALMDCL